MSHLPWTAGCQEPTDPPGLDWAVVPGHPSFLWVWPARVSGLTPVWCWLCPLLHVSGSRGDTGHFECLVLGNRM